MTTLVTLLIVVLIVSIIWWIAQRMPLPEPGKLVFEIVLAIILLLFLFGVLTGNVPRLHFD